MLRAHPGGFPWTVCSTSTNRGGFIPAIAQDYLTGEVLMLAYMNRAAFEETVKTRRACYYSRSRNKLWHKGKGLVCQMSMNSHQL